MKNTKQVEVYVDLGGGNKIAERRREPRVSTSQDVRLKVRGWAGLPNPMHARIVDMSGKGVRLSAPVPVDCGKTVEITGPEILIEGEVCRCHPETVGYSLGVRIAVIREGHPAVRARA